MSSHQTRVVNLLWPGRGEFSDQAGDEEELLRASSSLSDLLNCLSAYSKLPVQGMPSSASLAELK